MRRPEGFTSRRRRYLAKKVDRLDRLETRTTMTEPISVVGLMMGSLRWLEQLGIVDKNGWAILRWAGSRSPTWHRPRGSRKR